MNFNLISNRIAVSLTTIAHFLSIALRPTKSLSWVRATGRSLHQQILSARKAMKRCFKRRHDLHKLQLIVQGLRRVSNLAALTSLGQSRVRAAHLSAKNSSKGLRSKRQAH